MARFPRIVVPGQALHIVQRGNNRQPVFFADEDYMMYLETFQRAATTHGCAVHAYVLMTNHVHILLTPEQTEGPSRLMQAVGRQYVRYVNGSYRRTGTLWEGRFKSALIDSARYLLTCSRYIELNPVRAGMVDYPGKYRWSSYRCNALGHQDGAVSPHPLYEQLGSDPDMWQAGYRGLFAGHIDESDLRTIREGTEKGVVIGNDRFREEIAEMVERRVTRYSHGGDRKSAQFRERKEGH
jgi:putative transposase